jgi:hypothetical protein
MARIISIFGFEIDYHLVQIAFAILILWIGDLLIDKKIVNQSDIGKFIIIELIVIVIGWIYIDKISKLQYI